MKFNISIINVTQQVKPTAKGSYTILDVAYKNEQTGKTEGKKVMSFAQKETFAILSKAIGGQSYTIESVKNEQTGYWDWVNAELTTGESQPVAANKSPAGNATPKSTYETAEERATRQVLIVRQSSLTAAINTLKTTKELDPFKVIELATLYNDWVFQKDIPNPDFSDMEDDVPQ